MKIIVTEIQKFENGNITTLSHAFDNINSADSKYHTILASAATSNLPVHSCIMFTEDGNPIKHECYLHESVKE